MTGTHSNGRRVQVYLTLKQAQDVVDEYAAGGVNQTGLAGRFGVAVGTIARIVDGKSRFERDGLDRAKLTGARMEELRLASRRKNPGRKSALTRAVCRRLAVYHARAASSRAAYNQLVERLGISKSYAKVIAKRGATSV